MDTALRTLSPRSLPLGVVALALVVALAVVSCSSGGGESVKLSAAGKRGKALADENHCSTCHSTDGGSRTGPTWKDLAGSKVKLVGGATTADDAYLKRSITKPSADVVDGYTSLMQPYGFTAEELDDLVAYLHDLSSKDG